ncbi:MAG: acetylornithine deacetylase [Pseudomonadota bacterium]
MTRTIDILSRLVAFDTVSSNSNLDLLTYVRDLARRLGGEADIIPGAAPDKGSLWARFGPAGPGGVVLSGHSDVVPVAGQDWDTDPFEVVVRDDRAYGRGTADMKGFVAAALSALHDIDAASLTRPIYLALTYDEEVGCQGAPHLIDWMRRAGVEADAVFVGEPTLMGVVNAHKGICVCRTEITGVEAHSSLSHHGVSAVGLAGRAIALLRDLEMEFRADLRDDRFAPDHATISVNRIEGGEAVNILAGRCAFDWDIRPIPAVETSDVRDAFNERLETDVIEPARRMHAGVAASTTVIADAPGLAPEPDGGAETLAVRLTGRNKATAVPYAAEAGQYQAAGYSAVLVGPGSIDQAHQPNEWIALSELESCEGFVRRLGSALA